MLFFRLLVTLEDEIDGRGVREFWRAAKAAIFAVEELSDRFDLRVNDADVEIGARPGKNFRLRYGIGEGVGGAFQLGALIAVRIGDGEK